MIITFTINLRTLALEPLFIHFVKNILLLEFKLIEVIIEVRRKLLKIDNVNLDDA